MSEELLSIVLSLIAIGLNIIILYWNIKNLLRNKKEKGGKLVGEWCILAMDDESYICGRTQTVIF